MKLEDLDAELSSPKEFPQDIDWHDPRNEPFKTHGVYYSENDCRYVRMPLDIAAEVKTGYDILATHTAGGRIRFVTDSDFVAVSVVSDKKPCLYNTPLTGSHGFGLYSDGVYIGSLSPTHDDYDENSETLKFSSYRPLEKGKKEITLYFPLYNGVIRFFVGLSKGASVFSARDYKYTSPIVYYGSSITQGGGVSHPGNEYTGILSRRFDIDYLNLGFSGTSKGEEVIAEYIASLEAPIYFIDYDSPDSSEEVEDGIVRLYKKIRAKNKSADIIFTTRPDFVGKDNLIQTELRDINIKVAKRLISNGDENVYYIDAKEMFPGEYANLATVENTHPNDLGYYLLSESIGNIIEKILKKVESH